MIFRVLFVALSFSGFMATNAISAEVTERSICTLPEVRGPCRAYFIRWRYNSFTGHCQKFVYGGCRGNANNFRTQQECEDVCRG